MGFGKVSHQLLLDHLELILAGLFVQSSLHDSSKTAFGKSCHHSLHFLIFGLWSYHTLHGSLLTHHFSQSQLSCTLHLNRFVSNANRLYQISLLTLLRLSFDHHDTIHRTRHNNRKISLCQSRSVRVDHKLTIDARHSNLRNGAGTRNI